MRAPAVTRHDVFGLVHPAVDAHTLGLSSVQQLLDDCGLRAVIADARVCAAANEPSHPPHLARLDRWIREHGITRIGFSYRLDPEQGVDAFGRLWSELCSARLLKSQGGPLTALYFAGLPRTCALVRNRFGPAVEVFRGDESPAETLTKLGVPGRLLPRALSEETAYDEARFAFARGLVVGERYRGVRPAPTPGYRDAGTWNDSVMQRLRHRREVDLLPVLRAHVGPYLPDRDAAVRLFLEWTRDLARAGYLDVLSIGTSQLTQSNFGEDWNDRPNGGGVPLNSPDEFRHVGQAARPMLVRTYAGSHDVPGLARMYEETINNAWHTFSLWWFSRLDGRGPNPVRANLDQHLATLRYVAQRHKPYEPNVPHHFAFRGADDVTYVVSGVLAARAAKVCGIRNLILQVMLNTPKSTWGVQDLAKARALLTLARELEDGTFRVHLQPRAGLDYFSPDLDRARIQLAAVTALMDDIEPQDAHSPPLIHVVSYSEGSHLADPSIINESLQITRAALTEYRRRRARGDVMDLAHHDEVAGRTEALLQGARAVLRTIDAVIARPESAEGLYQVFAGGFLPVPYLWECRDEFSAAVRWKTRVVRGSVQVVDEAGHAVAPLERARWAAAALTPERNAGH